jgi:hypothetical protein
MAIGTFKTENVTLVNAVKVTVNTPFARFYANSNQNGY